MDKVTNKKILNITKVVSIITVISLFSKLLGMLREVGIANKFGVGSSTDAFYVALVIPTLIFTSVGVALQNLFMAEFSSFKELNPNPKEQHKFINKMFNLLLVLAIILTILSFVFTKGIVRVVAPGFTEPNKYELTVTLTRILLPTMIIIPLYQIKSSVLRVFDRYISVALIDLCFNIGQLVYLYIFADKFGINGLTYSILIAYLFQFLAVEAIMLKMGYRYQFILDFKDQHIKSIFILFLPTLISFGIIQVNELVNKIIASNLGDGSVSALNYGLMVRNLVYNIITLSVLTVIYPKMLGQMSKGDNKGFNELVSRTINTLCFILVPISVIMLGFSESIIKIIFERGEFTESDTVITSQVLFYYTIGIVAFSLKDYFVRVAYSYKNTRLPLYITIIGSVANIVLSLILKEYMGVNGIALSLSISEILSVIIFLYFLLKNKYLDKSKKYLDLIKIFLINGLIFIGIILLKPLLVLPEKSINLIFYMVVYVFSLSIIYLVLCYIVKVELFYQVINKFMKRGNTDELENNLQ